MSNTKNSEALTKSQLYFDSKHDAHCLIESYKQNGYIKDCSNVGIYKNIHGHFPRYVPKCNEDSFNFVTEKLYFIGCPENCKFFKSHRQNKLENLIHRAKILFLFSANKLLDSIKWLFEYFKSLPGPSQIIILLILFVLIFGNSSVYGLLIGILQAAGWLHK